MARCVSEFNHFSFWWRKEKNVDISYFFAFSRGGTVWIVRVIKITFSSEAVPGKKWAFYTLPISGFAVNPALPVVKKWLSSLFPGWGAWKKSD